MYCGKKFMEAKVSDLKGVFTNILTTHETVSQYQFRLQVEKESGDYSACIAISDAMNVLCRAAKRTPTKPSYFVTVWRRNAGGEAEPYSELKAPDYYLIVCGEEGYFLFPKAELIQQGIVSTRTKEGKRGFRVYPPNLTNLNATARRTQAWQVVYFNFLERVN